MGDGLPSDTPGSNSNMLSVATEGLGSVCEKAMVRDELIRQALGRTNWDLLVCTMPSNVLLLSGYWPAVGSSVALATREGQIGLVVPEDEDDVAEQSWVDEVATYAPAPIDRLMTAEESVFEAFVKLKRELAIAADRIGFEQTDAFEPASYAPHMLRGSAVRLLRKAFPSATLAPADELLAEMRTIKTPAEIQHIRTACRIAEQAFQKGSRLLKPDMTEAEAAAACRIALSACLGDFDPVRRCDGFLHCMSGVNSEKAFGPYPRSRSRKLQAGDLVILRCHSYADGYWADITRTYHVGAMDDKKQQMFGAVFAARDAGLAALRPGVKAADVDRIARDVLAAHGLGSAFKHSAGHGVGFGAADPGARPRLHPKSEDVLEPGMVLKLETGVYLEQCGGIRKADMVAITENGAEILTRFHASLDELILNGSH
ncbi:MAG: M24 family metallopeptidase [Bryobacteraceae bacterium]